MDDQSSYFNVTAVDEAMHEPGPEAQWNESAFFHVVEEDGQRGALFRIGRRVNEGGAEVTALQLRAGGDALVGFRRPRIEGNAQWQAGGLDFRHQGEVGQWSVHFDGKLNHLADGVELLDPGRALRESPTVAVTVELEAVDLVPAYRTTLDGTYHGGAAVAKDHYAGIARVSGTIDVDGERRAVRGFGFRDHSWGERNWQAIDCWRWAYGQLGERDVFSVVVMNNGVDEPDVAGIVVRDGVPRIVTDMDVACLYGPGPDYWVERMDITVPLPDGPLTASLEPLCRLPLRHTRGAETLRIVEQLAKVEINGRRGVGWFEVTDRIEDGRPFGMTRGI